MNCRQMWQKVFTGKLTNPWPVLLDHYNIDKTQPGLVDLGRRWLEECDSDTKIKRALQTKIEAAGSIEDKLLLLKDKWSNRSP
jgi:hypothetical protein